MEISELQQLKLTHMHIAMKCVGTLEEVAGLGLCNFILSCLWPSNANLSLNSVYLYV